MNLAEARFGVTLEAANNERNGALEKRMRNRIKGDSGWHKKFLGSKKWNGGVIETIRLVSDTRA